MRSKGCGLGAHGPPLQNLQQGSPNRRARHGQSHAYTREPDDAEAVAGNLLATRCAALDIQQWKRGAFSSIENPLGSFMWDFKLFKRLSALPGVKFVHIDQCAFGCEFKKATGVLANAPWITEQGCENAPYHTHTTLEGKVWSYKMEKWVWYTSEAAEYPAAMCETWAREWVADASHREAEENTMEKVGSRQHSLVRATPRQVPRAQVSAQTVREQENDAAIGGMRNPNKPVARSDAWQQLGAQLRKLLDEAVEEDNTITTLVSG